MVRKSTNGRKLRELPLSSTSHSRARRRPTPRSANMLGRSPPTTPSRCLSFYFGAPNANKRSCKLHSVRGRIIGSATPNYLEDHSTLGTFRGSTRHVTENLCRMTRIQVFAHGLDFAVVEQHQQVVQIVIELPGPGHPVRLRFDRDTIVLGRRTCDCKSQPTRKVLGRVLDKPAIACLGVVRGIGIIRGPGDQLPGRVVRYAVPAERVATAELLEEIEYELTRV